MHTPVVAVHTIGQTPRPELTESLGNRFGAVRFEILGALDDLARGQISPGDPDGYPLETRLRDGTRVVIDAQFVQSLLQQHITAWDRRATVHLILCAGPFPNLAAVRPLIQPFDVASAALGARGLSSLEVVVPFTAQAIPAARKWTTAGFTCRLHVLGSMAQRDSIVESLIEPLADTDAEAIVFDYVGFPADVRDQVATHTGRPVFDLGDLALDELERTLNTL